MCGIGGIVGEKDGMRLQERCSAMQSALRHRGPDGQGLFLQEAAGVGLVHTRLAILDLSAAGHQPMLTADGRYTIVFNGEIYNFQELRSELVSAGVRFRSQSDTEVLLELYARDGERMLSRLEGMFALAIWDRDQRTLFLARDPLGVKQLYIWSDGEKLAFASEVRSVLAAQLGAVKIDRESLARYFLMGSVQEPDTLVERIHQLPAGHWMRWQAGGSELKQYWALNYPGRTDDLVESSRQIRNALDGSIQRHFVSDVPVGIFLSGGIDSTALVALAKANGFDQLRTFCISFDESEFNEGDIASRTAAHFGTQHSDWRLTAADARPLLDGFIHSLDLPTNDGFNTFCVSKLAHDQGLKVVLSGLGGDEMFGGYPSFQRVGQLIQWHRRLRALGPLLNLGTRLMKLVPGARGLTSRRLAAFLDSEGGPQAAYWTNRAYFTPHEAYQLVDDLTGSAANGSPMDLLREQGRLPAELVDAVGYLETTRYMRNQLLRDSDVMSMAHGLELRVPLVDRALSEAANNIASTLRYRSGKQQLVDAVPEIPRWVVERPKRGFRFPFENWVREQWAESFASLQSDTRVPLVTWYRKWTLFTLKTFLKNAGLL